MKQIRQQEFGTTSYDADNNDELQGAFVGRKMVLSFVAWNQHGVVDGIFDKSSFQLKPCFR